MSKFDMVDLDLSKTKKQIFDHKKMRRVYIAGKYNDKTGFLMEQNIRKAEHWALSISELGYSVNCPHSQSRFMAGTISEDFWIASTLCQMQSADIVFILLNWKNSTGTKGERIQAMGDDKILIYEEDLIDYGGLKGSFKRFDPYFDNVVNPIWTYK